VPDIANTWAEFDPQKCILLGKYFKNWANSHKNLNFQIFGGWGGKNDLATLDPHFYMVKISWSCIVAP